MKPVILALAIFGPCFNLACSLEAQHRENQNAPASKTNQSHSIQKPGATKSARGWNGHGEWSATEETREVCGFHRSIRSRDQTWCVSTSRGHIGTGDFSNGSDRIGSFESTPLMVDGTLYLSTPFDRVIALDPETGSERWTFDPAVEPKIGTSRGVAIWLDLKREGDQACRRRVFLGTNDARLMALDAATGKPCEEFGNHGNVDLTQGVARAGNGYGVNSPPGSDR